MKGKGRPALCGVPRGERGEGEGPESLLRLWVDEHELVGCDNGLDASGGDEDALVEALCRVEGPPAVEL